MTESSILALALFGICLVCGVVIVGLMVLYSALGPRQWRPSHEDYADLEEFRAKGDRDWWRYIEGKDGEKRNRT